ncbi:RpiB/LacA/LacB family sugar-phosphate isomerase [Roseburia hominis]
MKIAVINEVSASPKNEDIVNALHQSTDAEVINIGMQSPQQAPSLTYIHTSYIAAILLNTGCCDFVISGCGTGQGFLNAVLQFPGVTCGLIVDPLDAWLFSQINGGNCISLPLNKGYGWAGNVNLRYIFEKLFADPAEGGYPKERAESQQQSRRILSDISRISHKDFMDILKDSDPEILKTIADCEQFMKVLKDGSQKAKKVFELLNNTK